MHWLTKVALLAMCAFASAQPGISSVGLSPTVVPSPPPPPAPIAEIKLYDISEAIAVDVPYEVFARNFDYYVAAFRNALASVLLIPPAHIVCDDFQKSSSRTTVIFFNVVLESLSSSSSSEVIPLSFVQIESLFVNTSELCSGQGFIGCPGGGSFLSALAAHGLPAAGVYYNDQLSPSTFAGGPVAPDPGMMGTWDITFPAQAIVINVPYETYEAHPVTYAAAFYAGLVQAIGQNSTDIVYVGTQKSSAGTQVIFDVISYGSAYDVVTLFPPECPVGCSAGGLSTLVVALQSFGLPLSDAYYINAPPAPGRRLLTRNDSRRSLSTCGLGGCNPPSISASAVSSGPVFIELTSSAFLQYQTNATLFQIAYGVCYALQCNYENVTVEFIEGNTTNSVYSVVFWATDSAIANQHVDALNRLLPSVSSSDPLLSALSSLDYGGGLWKLVSVYPVLSVPPPPPHLLTVVSVTVSTNNAVNIVALSVSIGGLCLISLLTYAYMQERQKMQ